MEILQEKRMKCVEEFNNIFLESSSSLAAGIGCDIKMLKYVNPNYT
jgi:hypothetical protein